MDTAPGGLPANLIADPGFVDACAQRDIGTIFRMARGRAGFYASRIARQTGLTVSRVTEIMDGKRSPNSLDVIERIADGLQIPGQHLGLARRPWEPVERPPSPPPVETWEVLDTLTRSTTGDATLLHLEAAVLRDAALYPTTGPTALLLEMNRHLGAVHQLLDGPQVLRSRRRSVELLSVLSGLLGLAHLDTGDLHRSAAFFHMGQIAADEAEHDTLTAWLLTMQAIALIATGKDAEAVELLLRAQALASEAPHRRQAWIAAQLARAHVGVGQRDAALASLDRSAGHLDQADTYGGLDFFSPARLDGIHGTTRFLVGDHAQAGSLLQQALDRRDRGDIKGRALLTFDLAESQMRQGELEEGVRLAHAALDLVSAETVQPALTRAERLQHALAPWRAQPPVAELGERVKESRRIARD